MWFLSITLHCFTGKSRQGIVIGSQVKVANLFEVNRKIKNLLLVKEELKHALKLQIGSIFLGRDHTNVSNSPCLGFGDPGLASFSRSNVEACASDSCKDLYGVQ